MSSGGAVLRQALEKLYAEISASVGVFGSYGNTAASKGVKELRDSLKVAFGELSVTEKDGPTVTWEGFKLIAHGILRGFTPSSTSSIVSTVPLQSPSTLLSPPTLTAVPPLGTGQRSSSSPSGSTSSLPAVSLAISSTSGILDPIIPHSDTEGLSPSHTSRVPALHSLNPTSPDSRTTYTTTPLLIDDIITTVCSCFQGSQTDDVLQLAVVKCITTILTSARCEVHGSSLLRCAQTMVDLASFSRNPVHQNAARAGLTQIANVVVHRSESFSSTYLPLIRVLESHSFATDPALSEVLEYVARGNKVETFPLVLQAEIDQVTNMPIAVETETVLTKCDDADVSTRATPVADTVQSHSVHDSQATGITKVDYWSSEEVQLKENDIREPEKFVSTAKQMENIDNDVSTTDETAVSIAANKFEEGSSTSTHITPEQSSPRPLEQPTAISNARSPGPRVSTITQGTIYANPYQPPLNYYHHLLLTDTYLFFRLFVQLSMHSPTPATALTPSDLPPHVLKTRALSLELILAMLRAGGPQFRSDNRILGSIRSGLCLSLSRNAVVANDPHLFELGVSVYVSLMLGYRAVLKKELEVLSNNIFLHVLDMGSSSAKQKSTVLAGLGKLATDGQLLGDLYLNYDCEMDSVGVFERIIEICGKAARSRTSGPGDSRTLVDEDWRLRKQALSVLVGVVDGLAEWGGNGGVMVNGISNQRNPAPHTTEKRRLTQLSSGERESFDSIGAGAGKRSIDERRSPTPSSNVPKLSPGTPSLNPTFSPSAPTPAIIHPSNPLASVSVESLRMGSQFYKTPNGSNSNVNLANIGGDSTSRTSTSGDPSSSGVVYNIDDTQDRQSPEQLAQRKSLLRSTINLFNQKPPKGLKLLRSHGFIPAPQDPPSICRFLRTTPGFTKTALGEILGQGDQESIAILHAWIDSLDFSGKEFVESLRTMLQTFRLPGESQKIDRIVEKFADRFLECNPESFSSADTAYTLAYSVILLNVDQHSVKVKTRMDKQAFIRNNRGINGGGDLPEELLARIFDEISSDEIVLEEERIDAEAKQRELARSDRERTEMYKREMAQMQKRSQTLMKQARDDAHRIGAAVGVNVATPRVGTLPGAMPDYSIVASTFKSADNPELARVMFRAVGWNLLATFSLLFEAEVFDSWEDYNPSGVGLELSVKEIASGAVRSRTLSGPRTIVDLCLLGFTSCIRIASVFRLETERHAWVSALLKMGSLNQVSSMKPKNAKVVKTIITIGNALGEYLDGSWLDVLMAVSWLERAHLIDGDSARGQVPKRKSITDLPILLGNAPNAQVYATTVGTDEGASASEEGFTSQTSTTSGLSSTDYDPVMSKISAEFKNQEVFVTIDRLFSGTTSLSGDALLFFVKSLCAVSAEEVGMDSTAVALAAGLVPSTNGSAVEEQATSSGSTRRPSTQSALAVANAYALGAMFPSGPVSYSSNSVRMFSLQKVVEVASYNMSRIRFEFTRTWKVLQPYFNAMGTHKDSTVATFAVDSLRQLSYKFLERDELSHYNTQSEFLRSFEHIMKHNNNTFIREHIIQSVHQMVASRARNIRSGWKSIWNVLSRAAHDSDLVLVKAAFGVLELVFNESLEVAINAGSFADYIACLKDFAQSANVNADEAVVGSIRLLQGCALKLNELGPSAKVLMVTRGVNILPQLPSVTDASITLGLGDKASRPLPRAAEGSTEHWELWRESETESPGMATEQQFYLMWFPILSALSRLVIDSPAQAVRISALEALFEVLGRTGHLFNPAFWRNIKRSVILPLFEGLGTISADNAYRDDDDQLKGVKTRKGSIIPPTESSLWIQGLREVVDLSSTLFESLRDPLELIEVVMDLIATFVGKRNENIASTGAICLQRFLKENAGKLGEHEGAWALVTHGIARAFHTSLPTELMEWDFAVQASKSLTPVVSQEVQDGSADTRNVTGSEVRPNDSANVPITSQSLRTDSLGGSEIAISNNRKEDSKVTLDERESGGSFGIPGTQQHMVPAVRRTSATLDFELVVLRAAVHLEIVQTLRDLALGPARAGMDMPVNNGRTKQPPELVMPEASLICSLPLEIRYYWLHLFHESWEFAHAFNTDTQRRQAIFRKGYVPQMPNLSKQEAISMASWLHLMFVCYAVGGDEERMQWKDFDPRWTSNRGGNIHIVDRDVIDTRDEGVLVEILLREVDKVLEVYTRFMADTKRYHRELIQWAPVVVVVYQGLVLLSEHYGPSRVSSSTGTDSITHLKIRGHLRSYFRTAIKCMSSEREELRAAIQAFMEKMADEYMFV
ncbi:Brefeldin A-inhibited guanine nucleotide-exchange protein 1 [Gonapodya sp. JEL0774]|nr:Brefeldin A-inhibited guanine nucleotide-exchange protein 1 [Gonapodya sp. JEL0774]